MPGAPDDHIARQLPAARCAFASRSRTSGPRCRHPPLTISADPCCEAARAQLECATTFPTRCTCCVRVLQPTALRRAAAPVAMAGPAHRKPAAPPRAVAQLYTAAASLPFVMSSGAIAATGAGLSLQLTPAVEPSYDAAAYMPVQRRP